MFHAVITQQICRQS